MYGNKGVLTEYERNEKIGKEGVDELIERLQSMTEEARIYGLGRKDKFKLEGVNKLMKWEEIKDVLSQEGGCSAEEIQLSNLREDMSGVSVVVGKAPAHAVNVIMERRRLKVGWTSLRVRKVMRDPPRCAKCWGVGHDTVKRGSKEDKRDICFRCHKEDHMAYKCGEKRIGPEGLPRRDNKSCPGGNVRKKGVDRKEG